MWKKPNEDVATQGPTALTHEQPATERKARLEPAIVGTALIVKGNIEGAQDLRIEGEVEGTVELRSNTVTVGRSGRVRANIYAKQIIVEGDVRGDIFGAEQVIVQSSGHVRGNITAPRVTLEDGAKLKGSIDMDPQNSESNSKREEKPASASAAPAVNGSANKINGTQHVATAQ